MPREFIQSAAVLPRLPLAQIAYAGRPAVGPPHRAGAVRSGICRRPMRVRTRTGLPPPRWPLTAIARGPQRTSPASLPEPFRCLLKYPRGFTAVERTAASREASNTPRGICPGGNFRRCARRRGPECCAPTSASRTYGRAATPGHGGCGRGAGERGCRVLVSWMVSMTHRHWSSRTPASPWVKVAAVDHAAQPPRRRPSWVPPPGTGGKLLRRGPTSSYSPPRTGRRRAAGLLTRT